PVTYGEDNIIVCPLQKQHNFPRFEILTLEHERTHTLRSFDRQQLIEQCRDLHKINWPQRKIADHLNISLTTVNRYLSDYSKKIGEVMLNRDRILTKT
ncbi:MAG: helix-turn-helix domain-containing protein, partial [Pyrinomonadaceae bacterium]